MVAMMLVVTHFNNTQSHYSQLFSPRLLKATPFLYRLAIVHFYCILNIQSKPHKLLVLIYRYNYIIASVYLFTQHEITYIQDYNHCIVSI